MKQLTPTLRKSIQRFALLKRVEKRLADKLEAERAKILAYAGNQAETLVFNDEKLASIIEATREGIDSKKLKEEKPELFQAYSKVTKYLTLKLH